MKENTIEFTKEHIGIIEHTVSRSAGGRYCGDSPEMKELIIAGLMESAGKCGFVPDEYFCITAKGQRYLDSRSTNSRPND